MPHNGDSLVTAAYPEVQPEFTNADAESNMSHLIEVIKAVRNIRAEANAPLGNPVDILIKTKDNGLKAVLENNREYIDRFGHPDKLEIGTDIDVPDLAMTSVITDAEISIPLAELIDLNDEIARLEKEVKRFESEVERAKRKLSNKKFVDNAPEKIVAEEKTKQQDNENKLKSAEQRLAEVKKAAN